GRLAMARSGQSRHAPKRAKQATRGSGAFIGLRDYRGGGGGHATRGRGGGGGGGGGGSGAPGAGARGGGGVEGVAGVRGPRGGPRGVGRSTGRAPSPRDRRPPLSSRRAWRGRR